jgi:tetratricopeptide (TPR) repeat protein
MRGATPARLPAAPEADPELDPSSANVQPEFIDLESDSVEIQEDYDPVDRNRQDGYGTPSRPRPDDQPPCGPRLRPDDLSPSGPRPQPPPPAATPSTPARPMNPIELDHDGAEPPWTENEPPPEAPQPAPGGSRSPAGPPPRPRIDPFDVEPPPAYYDQESELASGSHRARKLLAQARHQAQLNRTIEAVQTLEQVVRLPLEGETAYEAWLMLGRLRSANPAWSARAFQALQTACRIHPREAEPWAAMGELHRRQGDEQQALTCYRKALALNPSQPVPADLDLRETPRPAPAAKPPAKGLLGSFRSLLGRRG